MKLSVIIPTLNSEKSLGRTLDSVFLNLPDAEVIIADGGSSDFTESIAEDYSVKFFKLRKGRGWQLNGGANIAQGDLLIFLHADTALPANAQGSIINAFKTDCTDIAKFRLNFDHEHCLLNLYGYMTRFDSLLTSFGDQCIVVRKDFFIKIGRFPEWPLFEDVHFFQKARIAAKVMVLDGQVTTSAERFLRNGIMRQQWINLNLIISYLLGENPEKLYQKYSN